MTLQLSKRRPYKAYVKKLENGFGIKTINTLTGVENIIVITANSTKGYQSDMKKEDSQLKILRPLLSNFSAETVSATLSIPNLNKHDYEINKAIAHFEPYLRDINADIAGFHMFQDGNANTSPNVQKTSVIFVANTESARKKGVHFNVPGKLMNVFFVDGQNKEGKIKFKADSVVKPLTIVVSNYVLHINICYDMPSKTQTKTVGTQTKKRYVLSSLIDDNIPMFKLEPSLLSDFQVKSEQKCTQTEISPSISVEESQSSQIYQSEHFQDSAMQTIFFTNPISFTSKSSSYKILGLFGDKSSLNIDEGHTKIESFENSSKQTINSEHSLNSFLSYDSHTHLNQNKVLQNDKYQKNHKTSSIENKKVRESIETPTTTGVKKEEKKTLTLFDNSSNYNTKTTRSDTAFNHIAPYSKYSSLTVYTSTKSASFEDYGSKTSVKTANSYNGSTQLRNTEESSNVSIKDDKERLNTTTLSLQQMYSVVELLEEKSGIRSNSETTLQSDCFIEREQFEEFNSVDSSDQTVYFPEMKSRVNQSNSTTTCSEKSLSYYKDTTPKDILCERCGSFHIDVVDFECNCEIFGGTNIKLLKNKGCLYLENISKNVKEISAITNTPPDQTESIASTEHFNNEMQILFETNVKNSTTSGIEHKLPMEKSRQYNMSNKHKETKLLETEEDDIDNGSHSMTAEARTIFIYPEESIQRVVDCDYNSKLPEETFMNRTEFELEHDKIPILDHSLSRSFDDECSSQTLRECNFDLNNTNSSNENFTSQDCIKTTTESVNSSQTLTSSDNTLGEDNVDLPYRTILNNKHTELIKVIEEYKATQKVTVSNTVFLHQSNSYIPVKSEKSSNTTTFRNGNKAKATENGKVFYFTDVRNTKSWISLRKSLQSCNFNKKIKKLQGIKGKTTNSELITNRLKIKNLSSGDHLGENVLCKLSRSLEERLNTIPLFINKSNFLNNKYSSSSTLHIIPSSPDLLQIKSQDSSFQDIEASKKALEKEGWKSPNFIKAIRKLKIGENTNINFTTRHSQNMTFQKNFIQNQTDIRTRNNTKTGKVMAQNKFSNNKKKHNSKHKKSNLFCFFM